MSTDQQASHGGYPLWEYKREYALTEAEMNARGRQGWQLAAYDRRGNFYIWARPLRSDKHSSAPGGEA